MESSELGLPLHRAVTSDGATIEPQVSGGNRPCSRRRIVAIALTAGVTAGLVSWIACEMGARRVSPATRRGPKMGGGVDGTQCRVEVCRRFEERGPG